MKTLNYKTLLFILVLITLNFMKVIKIGGASFNMALSDVLLPFVLVVLLFELKRQKFNEVFYLWQWGVLLLGWLFLTGYLGILNPEIIDAGLKGLVGECLKTGIIVAYFYVGYNAMMYLNKNTLKRIWFFNTLSFIVFGLACMYLVKIYGFDKLLDPRYKIYFMGTYTDPNHAATFLGVNALILLNWSIIEREKTKWLLYGFVGLIASGFILLTDSRGGLIAFGLGVLILCLVHFKSILSYSLEIFSTLLGIILLVFMVDNHFMKSGLISTLYYSFQNFENGLSVREALSATALAMGLDHPFFGVGRGHYVLNAKPYFDAMRLNYIEKIPHNTYIGIFAETGIVGLVIFAVPIGVLIYIFIKKWSQLKTNPQILSLISMGIPIVVLIAVQAYVLNVENQRFLWVVIGIALSYTRQYDVNPLYKANVTMGENLPSKLFKKRRLSILLILMALFIIGRNEIYFNLKPQSVSEQLVIELPISHKSESLHHEVAFQILVPQTGKNQHSVEMELLEVKNDGSEVILLKKLYTPVKGVEKLNFIKSAPETRIKLIFKNINPTLEAFCIKPMYLKSQDQFRYMDRLYLLSINALNETPFYKILNNKVDPIEYGLKVLDQYEFDQYFIINTIKEDVGIDHTLLTLRLQVLEEMPYKTVFWFYGIPDNINVLNISQMPSGLKSLNSSQSSTFKKLSKEQVVFLTYEIPKDGEYLFRFGGYKVIKNISTPLKDLKTNLNYIELGRTIMD